MTDERRPQTQFAATEVKGASLGSGWTMVVVMRYDPGLAPVTAKILVTAPSPS